jgi:DNA-binding response OmpR family regulator
MIDAKVLFISSDLEEGKIWASVLRELRLDVVLETAKQVLTGHKAAVYDLIIFDTDDADNNMFATIERIHVSTSIPMLLFLPRYDEQIAIKAYKLNVNECIFKPCGFRLFQEKVKAWLRQSWTASVEYLGVINAGPFRLVPEERHVLRSGNPPLKLSNSEFRLLHVLMSHPGQTISTQLILDRIWGYSDSDNTVVKNVIYRLRRKLEEDPTHPRYIHSINGEGYVFQPVIE